MTQQETDQMSWATGCVRLSDGGTKPSSRQVALIPGGEAPLLELSLPKTLQGRAREQVAERQLQDRLGLEAKAAEMRPSTLGNTQAWSRVLVADPDKVQHWRRLGTEAKAILPDYLALPAAQGLWSFARAGGTNQIMGRFGLTDGFAAEAALAEVMFEKALAQGAPRAVLLLGSGLEALDARAQTADIPVLTDPAQAPEKGLPTPQVLGHGELALDLLQDPQLARRALRRQVLPWRWPLLLAGIATALWSVAQVFQTDQIEARTAEMTAATRALVVEHFVPEGPVLDMRVQVARALEDQRAAIRAGQAQVTPLDILAQASDVLLAQKVQSEQVSYGTSEGLLLVVRVADFAAVEQLAAALRETGMDVDVLESRISEGANGVRSELRLQGGT